MLDLGELVLHIKADASEATNTVSGLASSLSGPLGSAASAIGGAISTGFKAAATAVAATTTAVAGLTVAATNSYASYEQLIGGVETLFGSSASTIEAYANQAYQTAGISANQYMETVTSFSASLLQSLDGNTASAAEYANQAIIDMSDNANKMGTSMESIQNAYQGFAKQNYTMLDNLKLGYGGTKEEMERLIEDANRVKEANGEMADLSIDSFADVTEAIHIIQTEMGITGTTATEASTTIEGSVNSMKSAWENLVTDLGKGNADIGESVDELMDSVETALGNIIPAVQQILENITTAIPEIIPRVIEGLSSIITEVLPSLLQAGLQLLTALLQGISDNFDSIKYWVIS